MLHRAKTPIHGTTPPTRHTALISVAAFIILTTSVLAQDVPTLKTPTLDSVTRDSAILNDRASTVPLSAKAKLPLWEAGLFGLEYTQPVYPGSGEHVSRALVLPYLIYRGEYLHADRGAVGVRAMKTPRTEVDIGFSASLGSHSSDIAARRGLADLGNMVEFGPRLNINIGEVSIGRSDSRLQFPLRKVFDISHGFISRGIAFEPQWVNDMHLAKRWLISTNLGAMFGDRKLADTFYGVLPSEATPARASYTAKEGLIALRAGLFVSHTLTPDVRLFFTIRFDSLAGAANRDSPLVQRNEGYSAGIGLAWALARSEQSTSN